MTDEYVSHPIYVNYEASRNGIIRHRRRKVYIVRVNNMGYLLITVKNKLHFFLSRS